MGKLSTSKLAGGNGFNLERLVRHALPIGPRSAVWQGKLAAVERRVTEGLCGKAKTPSTNRSKPANAANLLIAHLVHVLHVKFLGTSSTTFLGGHVVASDLVDIHSHILPGLDDGAKTHEVALTMLKLAAESGTTDIVATPHANLEFMFDPEAIERKIAELQAAAGPLPRIHRGCDFHLTLENIQDALAHPDKYSINHKNYLLVEFSEMLIPRTTQEIFDRFLNAGLIPIVTHPERNALLHTRMEQMESWVANGALMQVTAQSLLGRFGRTVKSIAVELMNRNLVHFIASDAHDTIHRPPILREAYEHVTKTWGEKRAETLLVLAPQAVIDGGPMRFPDPEAARPPRKWWQRFT